ncbi:hypothetical protein JCM14202_458 [Agrilactobacillus composti DSM 18527 = JCM 14202]|nr:hypothetical protein [Agrilactobacillus composti]GAF38637.1 hypothetical protein JCM14202_458 [Agrilactobacillus composti DSM 18527 = JCM 14202]
MADDSAQVLTGPIVPRDAVKIDALLVRRGAYFAQAQLKTKRAVRALQQAQRRLTRFQNRWVALKQLMTCQLLKDQGQQQQLRAKMTQQQQLADTQQQQWQQAQHDQQQRLQQKQHRLANLLGDLDASQSAVIPGGHNASQRRVARVYYQQQQAYVLQQIQQAQQRLNQLQDQLTQLQQQVHTKGAAMQAAMQALVNRQALTGAKLADLKASHQRYIQRFQAAQTAYKAALAAQQTTFAQFLETHQAHNQLTPDQRAAFTHLPDLVTKEQLLTQTRYEQADGGSLAEARTEIQPKLRFHKPRVLPGFALDLDASYCWGDQGQIGSLRTLMAAFEFATPQGLVAWLNTTSHNPTGTSQRVVLNYVYQRWVRLEMVFLGQTGPKTKPLQAKQVVAATEPPAFTPPPSFTGYQLNWAQTGLYLDQDTKNYWPDYLKLAQGQGAEAVKALNQDIAAHRLAAGQVTLVWLYTALPKANKLPAAVTVSADSHIAQRLAKRLAVAPPKPIRY